MMKKKYIAALVLAAAANVFGASAAQGAVPNNPFDDVPKDHWAYQSIATLQQEGIIKGDGK